MSHTSTQNTRETEVLAAFVVSFDLRAGPVLEWSTCDDDGAADTTTDNNTDHNTTRRRYLSHSNLPYPHVEYAVLSSSGSHVRPPSHVNIRRDDERNDSTADYVIFAAPKHVISKFKENSHPCLSSSSSSSSSSSHTWVYGIAAINTLHTHDRKHRNALFRGAGIMMHYTPSVSTPQLSSSSSSSSLPSVTFYTSLTPHLRAFLPLLHNAAEHINQDPSNEDTMYDTLHSYVDSPPPPSSSLAADQSVTSLLRILGPGVFWLWRILLLRLRTMLSSTVHIGRQCTAMDAAPLLLTVSDNGAGSAAMDLPDDRDRLVNLFHISLRHADVLCSSYRFYLACSSDAILRNKLNSYIDAYLMHDGEGRVLGLSCADHIAVEMMYGDEDAENDAWETLLSSVEDADDARYAMASFFASMNDALFEYLNRVQYEHASSISNEWNSTRKYNHNQEDVTMNVSQRSSNPRASLPITELESADVAQDLASDIPLFRGIDHRSIAMFVNSLADVYDIPIHVAHSSSISCC
eukprot:gb/GECH01002953.1/.p1 GENE.gb/GECH01002953.1/~~gb/GECH01002953.1/.p1  ORF type:complete len:520 (+),score=96.21 gb/GECH01002953.1/:1-1560(+)